jgi:hypothetical protein
MGSHIPAAIVPFVKMLFRSVLTLYKELAYVLFVLLVVAQLYYTTARTCARKDCLYPLYERQSQKERNLISIENNPSNYVLQARNDGPHILYSGTSS